MFNWKPKAEKTELEMARDNALSELAGFTAETKEYKTIVEHVKTLTKLIDLEKSEQLSPNTMAMILGNALIAVVVVGYESKNVITTKVLNFMLKLK